MIDRVVREYERVLQEGGSRETLSVLHRLIAESMDDEQEGMYEKLPPVDPGVTVDHVAEELGLSLSWQDEIDSTRQVATTLKQLKRMHLVDETDGRWYKVWPHTRVRELRQLSTGMFGAQEPTVVASPAQGPEETLVRKMSVAFAKHPNDGDPEEEDE